MKGIHLSAYLIVVLNLFIFSCEDDTPSLEISYDEWTVTGGGLSTPVTKNVLTEFVGSTNCPYCPEADALLLSYFNTEHENYVGNSITSNWYLINYHTYSPGRGDPMYEFLRGATAEEDFCYVRFEEGSWYTIYGVPTTFTNGMASTIYSEMASSLMFLLRSAPSDFITVSLNLILLFVKENWSIFSCSSDTILVATL